MLTTTSHTVVLSNIPSNIPSNMVAPSNRQMYVNTPINELGVYIPATDLDAHR